MTDNVELYVAKPSNLDQALKFKAVIEATQPKTTQSTKSQNLSKPNINVKVPNAKNAGEENAV